MDRARDRLRERLKTWLPLRARNALRGVEYRARLAARALVPAERLRPSVLVIGAMKGGTSSLFMALMRHPGMLRPLRKEIRYFDLNWHRPPRWYWRHFPREAGAGRRLTGEASPGYLAHPDAASRAKSLVPDARIVVLLRHPVARAVSHYFHQRLAGVEKRAIEDALESPESHRLWLTESEDRPVLRHLRQGYVARGHYATQLRAWLDAYGRDRVLVLFSEEFFADPGAALAEVVRFAGLPPAPIDATRVYNQGEKTPVDRALEARLWTHYRDSIGELESMLGRPVPWRAP